MSSTDPSSDPAAEPVSGVESAARPIAPRGSSSSTQHRQVRVRRSPRIGVFLALGAALGALVALVFLGITPVDPQVSTPQALGFLVSLLAPLGALVGGAVAIVIDRVGERRSRVVQAEHTRGSGGDPDDD